MDKIDFSAGSIWGIAPDKFETLLRHFRDMNADAEFLKEAAAFKPDDGEEPSYQVVDGVAVIDIKGTITNRMSFYAWLTGAALVPRIIYDLEHAVADTNVSSIVLDIDSPGGVISGVDDVAQAVQDANLKKPVTAYTGGMMASAAYWIGSQAKKIVSGRTAELGSIGVFMLHEDWTKFDERLGITTNIIRAGKYKAIHLRPLTNENRAVLQAQVDAIHDLFISSVADGRGIDAGYVRESMADARLYVGQAAVDVGMADKIESLKKTIESAAPRGDAFFLIETAAASGAVAQEKENDMKFENVTQLESAFPDLVKEIREAAIASVDVQDATESARTAGIEAGGQAERQRIQAVLAQSMPGHENLVNELAFDGKTTGPQAAVQVLNAEKGIRNQAREDVADDAIAPVNQPTPPDPKPKAKADDPSLPIDERAKAQWDGDADLRAEFDGNYESFLAYFKANASGRVKIHGSRK